MLRVSLLLFTVILTVVYIIYRENLNDENLSFVKNFVSLKLTNPKAWGKIDVVEEKQINSLKEILKSEFIWQIVEQLVGFAAGVLICVLIGWRVSSYRNFYEKSFENSLTECLQRQNRFEKQLSALELQIVNFERTYLFTKGETPLRSNSSHDTSNVAEEALPNEEVDESYIEVSSKNEGLVRRAVEVIMKQDFDESNLECILEKLTLIMKRLSKLSKENIQSAVDSNTVLEQKQGSILEEGPIDEYSEKENLEVESKTEEIGEATGVRSEVIIEEEDNNVTFPDYEEGELNNYLSTTKTNCENSPYQMHPGESNEELSSNLMVSNEGAGECGKIFQGRIVQVSQIPQYQDLRNKLRPKPQKEYCDDEKVAFISCRNSPEHTMSERGTPQTTPRKHIISTPIENGADPAIKVRRKKQQGVK